MCTAVAVATSLIAAASAPPVNVEHERDALLQLDREWAQTTKDEDEFMMYFAADASAYAPGMPLVTGSAAIREMFTKMSAEPRFALLWNPTKSDVSASGDLGLTAGTYEMTMGGVTERGKYVTAWKKQADSSWKVTDDIFNADVRQPPSQFVMVTERDLAWDDATRSCRPARKWPWSRETRERPSPLPYGCRCQPVTWWPRTSIQPTSTSQFCGERCRWGHVRQGRAGRSVVEQLHSDAGDGAALRDGQDPDNDSDQLHGAVRRQLHESR